MFFAQVDNKISLQEQQELWTWCKENLRRQTKGKYSQLARFLLHNSNLYKQDNRQLNIIKPFILHMFGFSDICENKVDKQQSETELAISLYNCLCQLKRNKHDVNEELIQGLAKKFIIDKEQGDYDESDDFEEEDNDPQDDDESSSKSSSEEDDPQHPLIFDLEL